MKHNKTDKIKQELKSTSVAAKTKTIFSFPLCCLPLCCLCLPCSAIVGGIISYTSTDCVALARLFQCGKTHTVREKCVWFVLSSQSEKASVEQEEEFTSSPVSPLPQSDAPNVVDNPHNNSNNIVEVKDVLMPKVCLMSLSLFCPSVEGVSKLFTLHLSLRQAPKQKKHRSSLERSHETYRLLRRKNLIVEAVHNFKIIEGLFPSVGLQWFYWILKHFLAH